MRKGMLFPLLEISAEPYGRIRTVAKLADDIITRVERLPNANRIELFGVILWERFLFDVSI